MKNFGQHCPAESGKNKEINNKFNTGFISEYCGKSNPIEVEELSERGESDLSTTSRASSSFSNSDSDDDDGNFEEISLEEDVENLSSTVVDSLEHASLESAENRGRDFAELVAVLKERNGEEENNDFSQLSPRVRRRAQDFQFAHMERKKQKGSYVLKGIFGLFKNISDIRADLRWAEDAAWRRENDMPYVSWHDFEEKRNTGWQRPYLTYFLSLVFVVLMITTFWVGGWEFTSMKINPLAGPDSESLLKMGALNTMEIIDNGSWYRLITATLLHGGIAHLLCNVLAFWFVGGAIEMNHGILYTLFLFFAPGVSGNVLSALMQPGYVMVGASGGIFGLMGACIADVVLNWQLMFLVFKKDGSQAGCRAKFCAFFWLAVDVFCNSIIGLTPYVDNFAHLGGLIFGFLFGLTTLERLPLTFFGEGKGICNALRVASWRFSGAAIASFALGICIVALSQSDGIHSPCYSCRYLSCAPFPFWTEDKWWYCDGCEATQGEAYKTRGDAYYSELWIVCPNGQSVFKDVFDDQFSDIVELGLAVPDYCRKLC